MTRENSISTPSYHYKLVLGPGSALTIPGILTNNHSRCVVRMNLHQDTMLMYLKTDTGVGFFAKFPTLTAIMRTAWSLIDVARIVF
jgi:hypothetical protein